jgi:hypothetical protein
MFTSSPRKIRFGGLAARWLLAAAFFLVSGAPARANTYLFSFTASQLMTALQTSQGNAIYSESAYFAIFVQPNPAQISGYTYVSETTPNATDPNAWITNTITDPSSPNLGYSTPCTSNCTWAYFEKDPNATAVTLVSGANGGAGGANIFKNGDFYSDTPPPYGWGSTDALIGDPMPGADVFQFVISTNQNLQGAYTLKGYASAIKSGNSTSMSIDTKESDGIPFSLTVFTGVPEPGTWATIGSGGLLLGLLAWRRRRPSDTESVGSSLDS